MRKRQQMTEDHKRIIQEIPLKTGANHRPKSGYGSTNDRNTARRYFENSAVSASITGFKRMFNQTLPRNSAGYFEWL